MPKYAGAGVTRSETATAAATAPSAKSWVRKLGRFSGLNSHPPPRTDSDEDGDFVAAKLGTAFTDWRQRNEGASRDLLGESDHETGHVLPVRNSPRKRSGEKIRKLANDLQSNGPESGSGTSKGSNNERNNSRY